MIKASIGKLHQANITGQFAGEFEAFVKSMLKRVPVTEDKASNGWVCGATFKPQYRDSKNFEARHLLSLDYDHIKPEDAPAILAAQSGRAHLAYTTWSHHPDRPRLRVWIPLSRPVGFEEFQAISRAVAAKSGIDLAARESHVPAQFMYRPTRKHDVEFQHWEDTTSPPLDADAVLGEYDDWKDRSKWPRQQTDSFSGGEVAESPLEKPGVVGDFCRTFRISEAIERFQLPYTEGSSEGRWTYLHGSRPDGAISYDDDTKLQSHHDTDPAHGQHNSYDLVRLHLFGDRDTFDGDLPLAQRPSSRAMAELVAGMPEFTGFEDLDAADTARDAADTSWMDVDAVPAGDGGADGAASSGSDPQRAGDPSAQGSLPAPIDKASSSCTDQGNARRIQKVYGSKIIAVGGAFHVWQGSHWAEDEPGVDRLIGRLSLMVKHEADRTEDEDIKASLTGWARTCGQLSTMKAAKTLLESYLDYPADKLNAAPHLLTCRNGTVDLRTGELREHRQEDMITSLAPVNYSSQAPRPRFELFLREIFNGNEEQIAFLKRWFGYCLTGETREHALVFHVGPGGNGKGKLIELLEALLGNYACRGPRGLLTSKKGLNASPEIVRMLGKRMVTLNETGQNEEFDEALLKEITGGDRLAARRLFKDYIEFAPTHKLQVFTNSEPRINGTDRGIWRRIFKAEYPVRYGRQADIDKGDADKLQDDRLSEKLAAEREGVFAWLVEGAKEWYEQGLNPPPVVMKATELFRESQDQVKQFLNECTVQDSEGRVPLSGPSGLFTAYKAWAEEMRCGTFGRGRFMKAMQHTAPGAKYQMYKAKGRVERGFTGLRLRLETEVLPPEPGELPPGAAEE